MSISYNEKQKKAIAVELQKRFVNDSVRDYEIVVALLTMERAERITEADIVDILMYVFFKNKQGVVRALNKAKGIVDDELIDSIIAEV